MRILPTWRRPVGDGAKRVTVVGAVVGALLSAVTEPVVNRVLVKRIPLQDAINEIKIEDIFKKLTNIHATDDDEV